MLKIDNEVKARCLGLDVLTCRVANVVVEKKNLELEKFKEELVKEVKGKYTLDSLKDAPTFRAYRNFFWRVGIDPTKNRPAAEALIRRILRDSPIPNINIIVDAYNLASIKTEIALAAKEVLDYRPEFRRQDITRPAFDEMVQVKNVLEGTGLRCVICQTEQGHIGP